MPNKERLREWRDALLSGKYPQTKEVLRNQKGYCCLGVLCDVSGLGEWSKEGNDKIYYVDDFSAYSILPSAVFKYLDIEEDGASMVHVSDASIAAVLGPYHGLYSTTLGGLNDRGLTFQQIADIITLEFDL